MFLVHARFPSLMSMPATAGVVILAFLTACQSTPPPTGDKLSKAEIETMIVGEELEGVFHDGAPIYIVVEPDGRFHGNYRGVSTRGEYRLTDNGQWCRSIRSGAERCQTVLKNGDEFLFVNADGSVSSRMTKR